MCGWVVRVREADPAGNRVKEESFDDLEREALRLRLEGDLAVDDVAVRQLRRRVSSTSKDNKQTRRVIAGVVQRPRVGAVRPANRIGLGALKGVDAVTLR